jgi:SAM-dependent methyltransferase
MGTPRLYGDLASWFHLLSSPAEYAEEAELYARLLTETAGEVSTVFELGSGGGNVASHLRDRFMLTLTDVSPEMLDVSRTINPDVEHVVGDMRILRLGRTFDAVLAHDAVSYLTTVADLEETIETAAIHCRPGGAAVFVADFVAETWREITSHGGHDGSDRSLRYLEWTHSFDLSTYRYVMDMVYVMRSADGEVDVVHDRHDLGAFPQATWLEHLDRAGFDARAENADWGDGLSSVVFVARRR